jgi:hypothetical protein
MMLIVGCDPGKSFGVAVLQASEMNPKPRLLSVFQGAPENSLDMIKTVISAQQALREIQELPHDEIVFAIERYIVAPGAGRKSGASDTSPLVGRVTQLAASYPEATLALQTSADAARGFPAPLLRRLGLWVTPSMVGQHDASDANSAVRHVLLWLMRNRADLMEVLMKDVPLV